MAALFKTENYIQYDISGAVLRCKDSALFTLYAFDQIALEYFEGRWRGQSVWGRWRGQSVWGRWRGQSVWGLKKDNNLKGV